MKAISKILFSVSLVLLLGISSYNSNDGPLTLSFKIIDANNIRTQIRNNCSFDRDVNTGNAGFEWPKGVGTYAVYASGLWICAKINDSIHVSLSDYDSKFRPGYFDYSLQQPFGENDPLYRIYKVSPDFPSGNSDFDSWNVWPVSQGAPWFDTNHNGVYEPPADYPIMKGSQNFFYSATDGYIDTGSAVTPPLRAEIHFYAWAKTNSPCADAIHYEWKIINKSIYPWIDMSAAIWSDVDIGTSNNDLAGTDSSLNIVFGYNGTNNDPAYGLAPPAVGFAIQHASRHPGNNKADFACRFRCPFDCPGTAEEIFRVMHGLRTNGNSWINPYSSNTPTKFPFSGDPESHGGYLDSAAGERYIIMGSTFGNVAPLDTIDLHTVSFIKKGSSNLNSVTEFKNCVSSVIGIHNTSNTVPDAFILYQNYPNPFNPVTKIRFEISSDVNRQMSDVKLVIYDALGKQVQILVNDKLIAGSYEVEFDGRNLSSGVYFYKLISGDYSNTKRMIILK